MPKEVDRRCCGRRSRITGASQATARGKRSEEALSGFVRSSRPFNPIFPGIVFGDNRWGYKRKIEKDEKEISGKVRRIS